MYPNVLTAEAVMGMERAMVDRQVEDERARHIAMLVFTRNAVAPVDFTPVVLGEQLGMDGGRPVMRSTTAAFELALPVVLHSGVQHYGLVPADLEAFPSFVFDYLTDVPASWDETRLIDGRPGEYAVLARRSGSRWFNQRTETASAADARPVVCRTNTLPSNLFTGKERSGLPSGGRLPPPDCGSRCERRCYFLLEIGNITN